MKLPPFLKKNKLLFLLLIGIVFALDFLSKKGAIALFYSNASHFTLDFLGIHFSTTLVTNTGAAWSLFEEHPFPLFVGRLLFAIALLIYLLFYEKKEERLFPFALILGGALGNIFDYLLYGHVIDMLHFNFWGYNYPTFNIADSAICIGILLLISKEIWKK